MKVAVTGAAGFLGKALVNRLHDSGHQPLAIVREDSDAAQFVERGIDSVCRDLAADDACRDLFKSCDALIHCAALRRDYGRREDFEVANVDTTKAVMDSALNSNLQKVVFISSASVYGNEENHLGTDEEADYGERVSDNYTLSKIQADRLVLSLINERNFPAVILRPGHLWGPGESPIIPFLVKSLKKRRATIVDNGENLLSLTFIDNVVQAILLSLQKADVTGKVFNITDGARVSSRKFVSDIVSILGIEARPRSAPYLVFYSMACLAEWIYRSARVSKAPPYTRFAARFLKYDAVFDISKAVYELGYQPQISYKAALTLLTPYLRSLYYGAK